MTYGRAIKILAEQKTGKLSPGFPTSDSRQEEWLILARKKAYRPKEDDAGNYFSNSRRSARPSLAAAASLASKTSANNARLASCKAMTFSSTVPAQMSL